MFGHCYRGMSRGIRHLSGTKIILQMGLLPHKRHRRPFFSIWSAPANATGSYFHIAVTWRHVAGGVRNKPLMSWVVGPACKVFESSFYCKMIQCFFREKIKLRYSCASHLWQNPSRKRHRSSSRTEDAGSFLPSSENNPRGNYIHLKLEQRIYF